MRNPVFCSKLVPCQCRSFMHGVYNPFCMILSGLYPAFINPEVCPELKGCFYYIATISYVLVNAEPNPEIRLQFNGFFREFLSIQILAFCISQNKLALLQ